MRLFLFGCFHDSGPVWILIFLIVLCRTKVQHLALRVMRGNFMESIVLSLLHRMCKPISFSCTIPFMIVVIRVDRLLIVIISGLGLASITLFPKGVVEILAVDTNPVAFAMEGVGVEELAVVLGVGFDGSEVGVLHLGVGIYYDYRDSNIIVNCRFIVSFGVDSRL